MKKIMQFRYEGPDHENNFPQFEQYSMVLANQNIFNDYKAITQLGIQGPVGMRFYLNKSKNPITIGKTGIYELDLTDLGFIYAIRFNLKDIEELVDPDITAKILVDILYEEG